MLTQCSQCKKTYSFSIAELRVSSSELYCPHCAEMLGKLKTFKTPFFFSREQNSSQTWLWLLGCLLCASLLAAQFYWLQRNKLSQNPDYRAGFESICQAVPQLPCELPVYKNLAEFEILQGDFQLKENHYEFQTVLSNQARFAQQYPQIKLSLLDFSGRTFAQRIFTPREYLGSEPKSLMPASETIEVHLQIALPGEKVGGYTFDLL
jgi:hypothetical protein